MMWRWAWILALFGSCGPAWAEEPMDGALRGQLQVTANGVALRATEAQDAVIYFRPKQPVVPVPPANPAIMTTRRKQFVPRILALPVGGSVQFPNEDPILHNAFSTSTDNAFDTGQYGKGQGKIHTFDRVGLVRVYCNVHHSMYGFILILDTPFHTRADAQGRFALTGLPPGEGELVIFHDRAPPLRQTVVVGETGPLSLTLEFSKRKVPTHTNKFGKPYQRTPNANY
ncbi:MAG: hypothetical protein IPK97_13640 [Ahniella sp.]|nr:hypothetical protein [Ahniella sp.]